MQKALEANGYEVIVDQGSVDDYHHAAVADVVVLVYNWPDHVHKSYYKMAMCGGDCYVLRYPAADEDEDAKTPWTNVSDIPQLVAHMNDVRVCRGGEGDLHVSGEGPSAALARMASSVARVVSKKV